jgi:hypothetical protein
LHWQIFRTSDLTSGMPRRITAGMPAGRLNQLVGKWLRSEKFRRLPGQGESSGRADI